MLSLVVHRVSTGLYVFRQPDVCSCSKCVDMFRFSVKSRQTTQTDRQAGNTDNTDSTDRQTTHTTQTDSTERQTTQTDNTDRNTDNTDSTDRQTTQTTQTDSTGRQTTQTETQTTKTTQTAQTDRHNMTGLTLSRILPILHTLNVLSVHHVTSFWPKTLRNIDCHERRRVSWRRFCFCLYPLVHASLIKI
jgi:hypothetical protein